jgi:hypothetical protein
MLSVTYKPFMLSVIMLSVIGAARVDTWTFYSVFEGSNPATVETGKEKWPKNCFYFDFEILNISSWLSILGQVLSKQREEKTKVKWG